MSESFSSSFKFGIFDHLDDNGFDISQQYADRLLLTEAYDRGGFYAYHLAEHHSTPHGFAPSPNLFLSAVAQRTQKLRLSPLVMLLNLYHPLRAFEEICMLDNMSYGRLDVGIGRGALPLEIGFFGVAPGDMQSRYEEASRILMQAMEGGTINHHGKYFDLNDVPIALGTMQKPHPPIWQATTSVEGATRAAAQRRNFVTVGHSAFVRKLTDAFWAYWSSMPDKGLATPLVGMIRSVVIAATEEEARAQAAPAYERWVETLNVLPRRAGIVNASAPSTFTEAAERGFCFAGTVSTVRDLILKESRASGVNYLLCQTAFGNLPLEVSLRTANAIATEIMPAMQTLPLE